MCTTQLHPVHSEFANLTKQAGGRSHLIPKAATNLVHFFKGVVHFICSPDSQTLSTVSIMTSKVQCKYNAVLFRTACGGREGTDLVRWILLYTPSFCNKFGGCPAEQLQENVREKNIAGRPWSQRGSHCRVNVFVNTEEKYRVLKKILLLPHFSWEQRLTLADRYTSAAPVLLWWPHELLQRMCNLTGGQKYRSCLNKQIWSSVCFSNKHLTFWKQL